MKKIVFVLTYLLVGFGFGMFLNQYYGLKAEAIPTVDVKTLPIFMGEYKIIERSVNSIQNRTRATISISPINPQKVLSIGQKGNLIMRAAIDYQNNTKYQAVQVFLLANDVTSNQNGERGSLAYYGRGFYAPDSCGWTGECEKDKKWHVYVKDINYSEKELDILADFWLQYIPDAENKTKWDKVYQLALDNMFAEKGIKQSKVKELVNRNAQTREIEFYKE